MTESSPLLQRFLVPSMAGAYGALFVATAWSPLERDTWLLENLMAVPLGLVLLLKRERLPFGAASYAMLFTFLGLHAIGSHFTYSQVPYRELWEAWTGTPISGTRNHYDRFVHFAFGLLLTWPLVELWRPRLGGSAHLALVVALASVLSLSTLYELLEWGAAWWTDPELGIAFVGAQGDVWDAQKDTALALLGSILAAGAAFAWFRAARPAAPADRPATR